MILGGTFAGTHKPSVAPVVAVRVMLARTPHTFVRLMLSQDLVVGRRVLVHLPNQHVLPSYTVQPLIRVTLVLAVVNQLTVPLIGVLARHLVGMELKRI